MKEKEIINNILVYFYNKLKECYSLSVKYSKYLKSHKDRDSVEYKKVLNEYRNNNVKYSEYKKIYDILVNVKDINSIHEINKSLYNELTTMSNQNERYYALYEIYIYINGSLAKANIKEKNMENQSVKIYDDPDIKSIIELSDELMPVLKEYYIDSSDSKRKKVYDLTVKRNAIVEDILKNDLKGMNILSDICYLENEYCSHKFNKQPTYSISSNKFENKFKSTINTLGDVLFYRENSKSFKTEKAKNKNLTFNEYMENLLRSFNNIISSTQLPYDLKSESDNLIGILVTYNIDGNYEEFKHKHGNSTIGSNGINKVSYLSELEYVNSTISRICDYAKKYIDSNGGKINIEDTQRTKEDVLREIENNRTKLFEKILEKKQMRRR